VETNGQGSVIHLFQYTEEMRISTRHRSRQWVLRNRFKTFSALGPQQNLVQLHVYQTTLKIRMFLLNITDYVEIKINPPPHHHDVNTSFRLEALFICCENNQRGKNDDERILHLLKILLLKSNWCTLLVASTLNKIKVTINTPTCFGSRRNHLHGVPQCLAKTIYIYVFLCTSMVT
jgi:hypothetical protein